MTGRFLAVALALAAIIAGWVFADNHYRLAAAGAPTDQYALAHRESAYTSMTFVASPSDNYLQLRFFANVEGGVCLRPTWADLCALRKPDGSPALPHLIPAGGHPQARLRPEDSWPAGLPHPDPGTLNHSAYISLFPFGLLLNQRLMAEAGPDPRAAKARILVVGLGSGVGMAQLAHHFPDAAISVVDIDQAVIDIVRDHFPLIDWLGTQKTSRGEPRLEFIARDARQYIRYDARQRKQAGKGFDLIILDAYTAGSTIPPHLMTREFFSYCGESLTDGGLVLANVIGSYGKEAKDGSIAGMQHRTLGGAIRSLRAAGLTQVWNFPIVYRNNQGVANFTEIMDESRNNIVIAARTPVDPKGNADGWARLRAWVPFPELPAGVYTTAQVMLARTGSEGRFEAFSSYLPTARLEAEAPELARLPALEAAPAAFSQHLRAKFEANPSLLDRVRLAGLALASDPLLAGRLVGWSTQENYNGVYRTETDSVRLPREVVRISLALAKDGQAHSGEALVGPVDPPGGERPYDRDATFIIRDAPLFTDQKPNADIWNR